MGVFNLEGIVHEQKPHKNVLKQLLFYFSISLKSKALSFISDAHFCHFYCSVAAMNAVNTALFVSGLDPFSAVCQAYDDVRE